MKDARKPRGSNTDMKDLGISLLLQNWFGSSSSEADSHSPEFPVTNDCN